MSVFSLKAFPQVWSFEISAIDWETRKYASIWGTKDTVNHKLSFDPPDRNNQSASGIQIQVR